MASSQLRLNASASPSRFYVKLGNVDGSSLPTSLGVTSGLAWSGGTQELVVSRASFLLSNNISEPVDQTGWKCAAADDIPSLNFSKFTFSPDLFQCIATATAQYLQFGTVSNHSPMFAVFFEYPLTVGYGCAFMIPTPFQSVPRPGDVMNGQYAVGGLVSSLGLVSTVWPSLMIVSANTAPSSLNNGFAYWQCVDSGDVQVHLQIGNVGSVDGSGETITLARDTGQRYQAKRLVDDVSGVPFKDVGLAIQDCLRS